MTPAISYLIFTHNEGSVYLEPLFQKLFKYKEPEDEIIVVDDFSTDTSTLATFKKYEDKFSLYQHALEGDFSKHKNYGKDLCKGEYIFQIDADENPAEGLMALLKEILLNNVDVDLFWVPRVNLVKDLTEEDRNRWGWNITEHKGLKLINFPDVQGRIWRNIPDIKWQNAVHEVLVGHTKHTILPYQDVDGEIVLDYTLFHGKTIDRQRKQNTFYESIVPQ